jgi:hypothetical protein
METKMIRTTLLAATVAGALGGIALMAMPVAAPAGQAAQAGHDLIEQAQYYRGPRRYYGPRPYYRPRCFWSERRVWNGWRWVIRPVRVCR